MICHRNVNKVEKKGGIPEPRYSFHVRDHCIPPLKFGPRPRAGAPCLFPEIVKWLNS
jgi:hypothetical protein